MKNLTNTTTKIEDFIKEKVLGKGSFGSVYLVTRKEDGKIYALKTVILEKLKKKEQENSVNEVRLLASVNHPNVIGYKEAFWDDKTNSLNIIMEYADDGDLQSKICKKKNEGKLFNEILIWLYSIQMIEGLKALHSKKIMHRDLKSANIFLMKENHQCKLGDMNVSKVIKEKVLTTQTGTPYYASPEVWRDEPYSYKSDLWSIGCVIYEMCELHPPFNGRDLDDLFYNVCKGKVKRINKIYSDELWQMIMMLLQTDVNKRVDCDEFLNSKIIKKKIFEIKNNPKTYFEGCQLEKNMNIIDDFLLETINFKNISEIKGQLPNEKNYDSSSNIFYRNTEDSKKCDIFVQGKENNNTNYSVSISNKSTNNCNGNINQQKLTESASTNHNISQNSNIKKNNNTFSKREELIITNNNNNSLEPFKNDNIDIIKNGKSMKILKTEDNEKIIKKSKEIQENFIKNKNVGAKIKNKIEYNKIKYLLRLNRKKKIILGAETNTEKNNNKPYNGNLKKRKTENNKVICYNEDNITNNNLNINKIFNTINVNHNLNLNSNKRLKTEDRSASQKNKDLKKYEIFTKHIIKTPMLISQKKANKERPHSHGINKTGSRMGSVNSIEQNSVNKKSTININNYNLERINKSSFIDKNYRNNRSNTNINNNYSICLNIINKSNKNNPKSPKVINKIIPSNELNNKLSRSKRNLTNIPFNICRNHTSFVNKSINYLKESHISNNSNININNHHLNNNGISSFKYLSKIMNIKSDLFNFGKNNMINKINMKYFKKKKINDNKGERSERPQSTLSSKKKRYISEYILQNLSENNIFYINNHNNNNNTVNYRHNKSNNNIFVNNSIFNNFNEKSTKNNQYNNYQNDSAIRKNNNNNNLYSCKKCLITLNNNAIHNIPSTNYKNYNHILYFSNNNDNTYKHNRNSQNKSKDESIIINPNISYSTKKIFTQQKISKNHPSIIRDIPKKPCFFNSRSRVDINKKNSFCKIMTNINLNDISNINNYTNNCINCESSKINQKVHFNFKKINRPVSNINKDYNTININKNISKVNNNDFIRYKRGYKSNRDLTEPNACLNYYKKSENNEEKPQKKLLNISANEHNINNSNSNNLLKNGKPLFINAKTKNIKIKSTYNKEKNICQTSDNDSKNCYKMRKSGKNINENIYTTRQINSEINEINSSNNQIYNNYYSINNIGSSNLPFKVINVFN